MPEITQSDNFYAFRCRRVEDRRVYFSACQKRLRDIGDGDASNAAQCWPECTGTGCQAASMIAEEMMTGMTIYYLDRDDAGIGIVGRAEQGRPSRTASEREFHHLVSTAANLKVDERKESPRIEYRPPTPAGAKRSAVVAPIADETPTVPVGAFDLGSMISAEARTL